LANLLCVCNYPANTGYAWDFIESLYASLANRLTVSGVRTFVAYPEIGDVPRTLAGSAAEPVRLAVPERRGPALQPLLEFLRARDIRVVYLTDRHVWSWTYPAMRRAGVERIIVHDHVSGEQSVPHGWKRLAKMLFLRTPGILADLVIAVSDFVARRQREVGCVPPERVIRIWNGVLPCSAAQPGSAHRALGIDPRRPLVMCTCRSAAYKGVHHLLRAFDRMLRDWQGPPLPFLVYAGDGPAFGEYREIRDSLAARDHILLAGYRPDARQLSAAADLCVVPSQWAEAFALAVLEGLMAERPVVASNVGAIPELISNGETGLLVPPGDEPALAAAMFEVLTNPDRARVLGAAGRRRALQYFTYERQMDDLYSVFSRMFAIPR
jgi:glycosyltransferase involved in cell wall biosynthesis